MSRPVLRVEGLSRHFPARDGVVRAVDDVSFEIAAGETLGLVGESGCGKSTLARTVVRLLEPTAGRVLLDGRDVTALRGRALRALRAELQIVFQDPYASLNPRMRVGQIVSQPLRVHGRYDGSAGPARVRELFDLVGLDPAAGDRFPHEFSGGQRQRIGIARALALEPRVLVLDEPVSALDVSVRAQIVALLHRLQRDLGLAYLFIAHDLAVVRQLAHRVAVMYLGRIVETGPRDAVFGAASHPYTRSLLSAVPVPDPAGRASRHRILLLGDPPDAAHLPSGCRFRTRCWKAAQQCAEDDPPLVARQATAPAHLSACHFAVPSGASVTMQTRVVGRPQVPGAPEFPERAAPKQQAEAVSSARCAGFDPQPADRPAQWRAAGEHADDRSGEHQGESDQRP